MPVALPYRFDTTPVVKQILRGVLGLGLIVLAGLLYSLLLSHDRVAAVQLLLIALIVAYFGRLLLKNLTGSTGTLDRHEVVVEPGVLHGMQLQSPAGRFPLQNFESVRVERMSPLAFAQGGPHERVSLVGRAGTPDILVARTSEGSGITLGQELATALGLQYREDLSPY
jgi:hypothetical protein